MKEAEGPIDPQLMTKEYWGGKHSLDDDCDPEETQRLLAETTGQIKYIGDRNIWAAVAARAPDPLKVFLQAPSTTPIREFSTGQLFHGASYPTGTILEFDQEVLRRSRGQSTSHAESTYWGVVQEYNTKGKSGVAIWRYPSIPEFNAKAYVNSLILIPPIEAVLLIGETTHRRRRSSSLGDYDVLDRITRLVVHKEGSALRQRAEAPTTLPSFGVFRPGLEHPAKN